MPPSLNKVVIVIVGLNEKFCGADKSIKRRVVGKKGERRGKGRREDEKERRGKERKEEEEERRGKERKGEKMRLGGKEK